jgi:hypothetical protein
MGILDTKENAVYEQKLIEQIWLKDTPMGALLSAGQTSTAKLRELFCTPQFYGELYQGNVRFTRFGITFTSINGSGIIGAYQDFNTGIALVRELGVKGIGPEYRLFESLSCRCEYLPGFVTDNIGAHVGLNLSFNDKSRTIGGVWETPVFGQPDISRIVLLELNHPGTITREFFTKMYAHNLERLERICHMEESYTPNSVSPGELIRKRIG